MSKLGELATDCWIELRCQGVDGPAYSVSPYVRSIEKALAQARADAIEAASRALIEYYGHSSGCGQIFEWPFSKEMVDGCNCYTSTRKELSILRALKSQGRDNKT